MCATCKTYADTLDNFLKGEPTYQGSTDMEKGQIDYSVGVAMFVRALEKLVPILGPKPIALLATEESIQIAMGEVMAGRMPLDVMLGAENPRVVELGLRDKHGAPNMGGDAELADAEDIAIV